MSKIKITTFSISLDGFGAGPLQSLKDPLGIRGEELHAWMFEKANSDGTGVDNDIARKSMENVGAWIIGRNMFGPVRGAWPDDEWKGWWGEQPPFHVPVFVLTHHARESFKMEGGTTFHFVTGGIEAALEEAKKVADGKDIRIGGGVSTVHQFLRAGYVDEIQLTFSPIFLGSGENLFSGIDLPALGFNKIEKINGENATHIILKK
ncbi:dihydrofolate reductase family protein [Chitinophaga niabensis]|uniref:Dihydrofolate reductase n=1 Tax=Chitinophaga niabensis TaxID=536979 RepID=A0A1N6KGX3_9BACT|nr:dihydrofolate reductase family protein [Chitinophaga niabensis]SIO55790.1 Dihydrofolate reductase [Chitinophaga niabensis]